jgi:hypothetical protein
MSDQPPEAEAAPPPPRPARAGRPSWLGNWEGACIAVAVLLIALVALTGAAGGTMIALAAASCLVLAAVAALRRNATVAVVSAVMGASALTAALGLSLGDRARAAGDRGYPFPAVVGLSLDRARALFDRHGPVHYVIKRVPYGAQGTVLRATGYSSDGTFAAGSTITLVVGTRKARPPQP